MKIYECTVLEANESPWPRPSHNNKTDKIEFQSKLLLAQQKKAERERERQKKRMNFKLIWPTIEIIHSQDLENVDAKYQCTNKVKIKRLKIKKSDFSFATSL